jgi:phosphoribosylanthranilate isomerase
MTTLKICGLTQTEHVLRCVELGVEYVGFVAFPPSPRHVTPEKFFALNALVSPHTQSVLVTVDATAELLDEYRLSHNIILQCHGAESPARLHELKTRYGCTIIKALSDPTQAAAYVDSADMILLDAAPAAGELPGGNARSLDWGSLSRFSPALPWFLSGGLTSQNIAQAIRITGATMIDVSSGVERIRGVKDSILIKEFVDAARC